MLIKKSVASILAFLILTSNALVGQGGVYVDNASAYKNQETIVEESIVQEETVKAPVFKRFEYQIGLSKEEALNQIAAMEEYLIYLTQFDIEPQYYEMEEHAISLVMALYYQDISYYEKWEEKMNECPAATIAWLYMKENFGWSDEVCAGIMGNFMVEVGGEELQNIKPFVNGDYDGAAFGLCQWRDTRKTQLKNLYGEHPTIEQQLEFMYYELTGTNPAIVTPRNCEELSEIFSSNSPEHIALILAIYIVHDY